jgi:hypothetical protein
MRLPLEDLNSSSRQRTLSLQQWFGVVKGLNPDPSTFAPFGEKRGWLGVQRIVTMSNPYRVFAATPIADSNPLIDVAVRPFLPMIFPTSLAATVT